MIVIRLTDGVQKLRFTAHKDGVSEVVEYSLRNLTREGQVQENAVLTEGGDEILTEGGDSVLFETE